ncbi:MAG: hypothetical protein QOE90_3186 [Thermoplasmata archaeon]|jgi:exosortase/archaeosortase family protein|nr:hypothetical protein [Thermoplasmata archaeon]
MSHDQGMMKTLLASRARAVIGLATLGQGLLIVTRVVPHESFLVGSILALGGVLLLWRANMPRLERLPAKALVAALGAGIALGVLAYDVWKASPLDAPKLVIIGLGLGTALATCLGDRRILGAAPVASWILWSIPLAWGPLVVWAAQGAMKTAWGTTPLESFTHYALLLPLAGVLSILGHAPSLQGSVITYGTPRGPIALEVGVACSGVQAMALFAGLVGVLLAVERPPFWKGLVWCVVGLAGVYVVNVLRLVSISLVGARWGIHALEVFHQNAGWVFFLAWTAIFVFVLTRRL